MQISVKINCGLHTGEGSGGWGFENPGYDRLPLRGWECDGMLPKTLSP